MAHPNQIETALRYLQLGDAKRALKAAKLASKQAPRSPLPPNVAGVALSALGRPKEAVPFFSKALKLKPDFLDARQNLSQALIANGRPDRALLVLGAPQPSGPQNWKHHYLMTQAHLAMGNEDDAQLEIDRALATEPKRASLLHLRSKIMLGLGRIGEAIETLGKALVINPNDVQALTDLSLPLARHSKSQAALDTVGRAVEVDPTNIPARFRLATQLVEMGRMSDAQAQYQALLDIHPGHPPALERLAELLPAKEAAKLEQQVRLALGAAPRNSEDRACLLYALSTVSAASGDVEAAQKALASANREMARLNPYDAAADALVTAAILNRFPATPKLAAQKLTEPVPYPVFVLGLPRSGTTLAEAILGMHPNVTPLGERGTLGFLLRNTIENDLPFTHQDAANLKEIDIELLPPLPQDAKVYTDKMPENYRLVGFLEMVHPNAKIIHIRRDPRDKALSMWKSHFSGTALNYTYDLKSIAAKFNLYSETMSHWHRVFPGQILNIQYEDLVADVETAGKQMAAFCGLDWHPDMARPDQSTAQVLTLSATQLRHPVHTKSVGKWRENTDILQPFLDVLNSGSRDGFLGAA